MALDTPNFFDEFERIRTPSRPYDVQGDYTLLIEQLKDACLEHNYLAAAPQNLAEPAELLSAIVVRIGERITPFVAPRIVASSGSRLQLDAYGNIFLIKEGRKLHPGVMVFRPVRMTLAYRLADEDLTVKLEEPESSESMRQSYFGAIHHEIDHLNGRLITDYGRERLVRALSMLKASPEEFKDFRKLVSEYPTEVMPLVLLREGDGYVAYSGVEFEGGNVPEVSPDALFVDEFFRNIDEVPKISVPRGGERLPIILSNTARTLYRST